MAAAVFRGTALLLLVCGCTSIAPDARTVEGTHWKVTAIDGRPTPGSGDFELEFERGRVSGVFGCNRWSANYAVAGETLKASEILSTMMACPGSPMSLEKAGLAVLGEPMGWTWISGRRLTLTSSAGSIALELQR